MYKPKLLAKKISLYINGWHLAQQEIHNNGLPDEGEIHAQKGHEWMTVIFRKVVL